MCVFDDLGPTDLYQLPVATSHEYGWWMKDGSPQKEKWTQSERHAHVNSEMTRFAKTFTYTFTTTPSEMAKLHL